MDAPSLHRELTAVCDRLLSATAADRVTVRLDLPRLALDVHAVAAEAVAPGIRPIGDDRSIRQWELPTVQQIAATLAPLVQEHSGVAPGIPASLQEHYGARAQVLAPLVRDASLGGWLSVHSSAEREWCPTDLAAIDDAVTGLERRLGWATARSPAC